MSIFPDISPAEENINTRTGGSFGVRGQRQQTRKFRVVTTNAEYGPNEICQADNLPGPYDPFVANGGTTLDLATVCVQLIADLDPQAQEDSRFHWIVTAVYSTEVPAEGIPTVTRWGDDPVGSQNNPWQEPPHYRWESETIQRTPPNDLDGYPFVNSAGQPFSPPLTFEMSRPVLILTRNQETFDWSVANLYAFAVNEDLFMDYPPGTVQCFPIHAELDHRGSIPFWRVSYRLRFGIATYNPEIDDFEVESFQPKILDAGMCAIKYLVFGRGTPAPIVGYGGLPVNQPVPLNGLGQQLLSVPDPVRGGWMIEPVYRSFRVFPSKPFAPILTTGVG